jgi:hypothetical protein
MVVNHPLTLDGLSRLYLPSHLSVLRQGVSETLVVLARTI